MSHFSLKYRDGGGGLVIKSCICIQGRKFKSQTSLSLTGMVTNNNLSWSEKTWNKQENTSHRIPGFPPQFYNPLAVWTWEDHFNFLVPCWVICDVKVAQSYPTFCNSTAYTIHRILQARILEWVATPFSRRSSQPRDWTQVSCIEGRFFTSWATGETLSQM